MAGGFHTELVRQLGHALGRDIPFIQASREQTIDVLSPSMGDTAHWYVDNVLAGLAEQPEPPTHAVEEITGHPGITFAQWAAEHTEDFAR